MITVTMTNILEMTTVRAGNLAKTIELFPLCDVYISKTDDSYSGTSIDGIMDILPLAITANIKLTITVSGNDTLERKFELLEGVCDIFLNDIDLYSGKILEEIAEEKEKIREREVKMETDIKDNDKLKKLFETYELRPKTTEGREVIVKVKFYSFDDEGNIIVHSADDTECENFQLEFGDSLRTNFKILDLNDYFDNVFAETDMADKLQNIKDKNKTYRVKIQLLFSIEEDIEEIGFDGEIKTTRQARKGIKIIEFLDN